MDYGQQNFFSFLGQKEFQLFSRWWSSRERNKTGVINDPLGQTHSLAAVANIVITLFCMAKFLKVERTDGRHVRKQLSLPAVTVDWPGGSIYLGTKSVFGTIPLLPPCSSLFVPSRCFCRENSFSDRFQLLPV